MLRRNKISIFQLFECKREVGGGLGLSPSSPHESDIHIYTYISCLKLECQIRILAII